MLADRIKMVMGQVFAVDPGAISDDATPGNIAQWDSLRHMNLVLALEEEFDIRFKDEQIEELVSFRLIELTVKEQVSDGGSPETL